MEIVVKQISDRGELVIPKQMREEIGLKLEGQVELIKVGSSILISPVKTDFSEVVGLFSAKGVDWKELDATMHELIAQ